MSIPNWDNTFLSSLKVYRKLRGGKWYLRCYKLVNTNFITGYKGDSTFKSCPETEGWCRYGGKSPMSEIIRCEDFRGFKQQWMEDIVQG